MERLIASYTTGYDEDRFISSKLGIKKAQQINLPIDCSPTRIRLNLRNHASAGVSTNILLRIETDSGGVQPSGTLVNSLSKRVMQRFEDQDYAYRDFYFAPGVLNLSKNTDYWLVLQHENDLINDSVYAWAADTTSPGYTDGDSAAMEVFGTWIPDSSVDFQFEIYVDEPGIQTQKRFWHKIYDSGNKYITTWSDVMNEPSFSWQKNGGMGEMTINLARSVNDFGENEDVRLGNKVKTIIHDSDSSNGAQIFTGEISGYEPILNEDGSQYISVSVISTTSSLKNSLVKDGSATTVSYSSEDPSFMFKDLIDKYNGDITYTDQSIDGTGSTETYNFEYIDYYDALNSIVSISPAYWHWYIDGDNIIHFKKTDFNNIDHVLYIGKHIKKVEAQKKGIGALYNVVYFLGGGDPNLYIKTERTSSISEYGRREIKIKDERVTTLGTAQAKSNAFLDENDHPKLALTIKVIDNSIDGSRGYDIEKFKPGDVVQVLDPKRPTMTTNWYNNTGTIGNMVWDVSFWDFDITASIGQPMEIVQIDYDFNEATLTLAEKDFNIADKIAGIDKDLDIVRTSNIPSTPS